MACFKWDINFCVLFSFFDQVDKSQQHIRNEKYQAKKNLNSCTRLSSNFLSQGLIMNIVGYFLNLIDFESFLVR